MDGDRYALRNIDLNLLAVFEAIYSAGNISRTARSLGLSQPTISNQLNRLRDMLGDDLFVRTHNGVQPTSKAKQIIGPIRDALNAIESTLVEPDEFSPLEGRRHFRIILLDQLEPVLVPPIIDRLGAAKNVTFETFHVLNTPPHEGLLDGSVDLVMSTFLGGAEGLKCEVIGEFETVLICRKNHSQITDQLTMVQFQDLRFAALPLRLRSMSFIDEELQRHDLVRHIVYQPNKIWSFPAIVSQTNLVGIVPRDFANYAASTFPIDIHDLPFAVPKQKLYCTWKTSRSNDKGLQWLRRQAIEIYGEIDP
ncbi:unnamed protein product [Ectocarpus sp. 12 AP-2014]